MEEVRLKKLREVGKFSVWDVDGAKVRRDLDKEFTNFGQHFRFPFIPEYEFWIDKEMVLNETRFFVDHMLIEWKLMKNGCTYDEALTVADMRERAERERSRPEKEILDQTKFPPPNSVHKKLLGTANDGISVWLIDGRMVRSCYFIDFTEGGHDHVYNFVPGREVWIDDDLAYGERDYIILHELYERGLMKDSMDYDHAHERASDLEWKCRHKIGKVDKELKKMGWKSGKDI